ncbi:MAG: hypothetical protein ABW178_09160 [Pseudoxanthomonas sp.]
MPGMTRAIVLAHDGTIGLENLEHGGRVRGSGCLAARRQTERMMFRNL